MTCDFETLYCKGEVGSEREGDNFETDSRAGKFVHSKQRRKWSHNYGRKKNIWRRKCFELKEKEERKSRTDDKRE